MFCRKCGAQNEEGANFCEKCGAKLLKIEYTNTQNVSQTISQTAGPADVQTGNQGNGGKKRGKTWKVIAIVLALAVILAAAAVAGFFALKDKQEKQQYTDAVKRGQKYLEEMDYESAEAEFLKAMSIAPKEAEPYLALSEIYLAQDEPQKAVEILEKASENVPASEQEAISEREEDGGEDAEEGEKQTVGVAEKLEEVKNLEKYTWVVEPEIEADDIGYCQIDVLSVPSVNDMNRQVMLEYAVIQRGSTYGLIGMDGELVGGMDYKAVDYYVSRYVLTSIEPKYESEYRTMWNTYSVENGEIVPIGGFGSCAVLNNFYYCGGLHNIADGMSSYTYNYISKPENPIPVQQTEEVFEDETEYSFETEEQAYALYADGKLVTDFEYEEMGSWSDGLVAVKKDGKWGYLNEKGKEVIPIKYDASWTNHSVWDGDTQKEFAYAASEGYVPLCKDGKWELRNTEGKLVIMPGVFEQICPVYDGKCWVKRNGKWGVIEVGSSDSESGEKKEAEQDTKKTIKTQDIDYEAVYAPIIQSAGQKYGTYNIYYKYDIDKDGVDELLVEEGTCEADYRYQVYTVENGTSVHLGEIPGGHSVFYADEAGGKEAYVLLAMGHMGCESVTKISIKNGKIVEEEQFSRELGANDEYYQNDYMLPYAELDDLSLLKE